MKRKMVAYISAAALLTALLAGCGGTGGQSEPPSTPPAPVSGEPAQGEELPTLEHNTDAADAPTVYMTTDISPAGLMATYEALNWSPTGSVAVKLSTGEPPNSNYLRPELIKDVVQAVDGTIVECNTAYGGQRSSTAMHYQVAEDHGFTAIADVVILDENGSMTIPVSGGTHLSENYLSLFS